MEDFRMRPEERISWSLQGLYQRHGYKKYRMGKFEEYELYLENKNFLQSRQIITFNDMDGRVLALKPDVTLSIVKNTHADRSSSEKFYYLENVYRFHKPSGAYREISQLGLEYLGAPDPDVYKRQPQGRAGQGCHRGRRGYGLGEVRGPGRRDHRHGGLRRLRAL